MSNLNNNSDDNSYYEKYIDNHHSYRMNKIYKVCKKLKVFDIKVSDKEAEFFTLYYGHLIKTDINKTMCSELKLELTVEVGSLFLMKRKTISDSITESDTYNNNKNTYSMNNNTN